MRKIVIFFLLCCLTNIFSGCGIAGSQNLSDETQIFKSETKAAAEKNVLVAYYSRSGHTRTAAEAMHQLVGGTLYEIKPEQPYSSVYRECTDRARRERDMNARPTVIGKVADIDKYDIIFVGYPIWGGKAPMFIYTFLESYDLYGKKIIPFATSGGSGIDGSISDLKKSAAGATVQEGLLCNDIKEIEPYLQKMHL